VPGCTDQLADNYDPSANVDDGTCDYSVSTGPGTGPNTGGPNTGGPNTGNTPVTFTVQDTNDPDTNTQPPPNI